jgi:hypothetical protein
MLSFTGLFILTYHSLPPVLVGDIFFIPNLSMLFLVKFVPLTDVMYGVGGGNDGFVLASADVDAVTFVTLFRVSELVLEVRVELSLLTLSHVLL